MRYEKLTITNFGNFFNTKHRFAYRLCKAMDYVYHYNTSICNTDYLTVALLRTLYTNLLVFFF